jgi:hypothetical protein
MSTAFRNPETLFDAPELLEPCRIELDLSDAPRLVDGADDVARSPFTMSARDDGSTRALPRRGWPHALVTMLTQAPNGTWRRVAAYPLLWNVLLRMFLPCRVTALGTMEMLALSALGMAGIIARLAATDAPGG